MGYGVVHGRKDQSARYGDADEDVDSKGSYCPLQAEEGRQRRRESREKTKGEIGFKSTYSDTASQRMASMTFSTCKWGVELLQTWDKSDAAGLPDRTEAVSDTLGIKKGN